MSQITYHASHEQFAPSELLHYVKLAEKSGFDGCHSSDHFYPWSKRQGQSGYAFSWLGAAMAITSFPFSVITAPGQRYHPAITAQAIATLLEMFPERLEVALGSGEAVNECITGEPWPDKPKRNERLLECYHIMKRLFAGEKVSHQGLVKVKEAKLYTLPATAPKFMCAALTEETARWAGKWADGLLTIHYEPSKAQKIIKAFKEGGGEGKPMHVQIAFSYARTEEEALEAAYDQWRSNVLSPEDLGNLPSVEDFDSKSEKISKMEVQSKIVVSSDLNKFVDLIQQNIELGYSNVILHNVNKDQTTFIDDFGAGVLPVFKRQAIFTHA